MHKAILIKCLLWLLACAVPLQGFASVSMFACGSQHESMHHPAIVASADDHHAMSHHHDEATLDEGHDGHDRSEAQQHHASDAKQSSPTKADKCSACSACCNLVAIVTAIPAIIESSPTPLPKPASSSIQVAYVVTGFERPPRATLS